VKIPYLLKKVLKNY